MIWTKEKPKKDGWYWLRYGDSYGWFEQCVLVDIQHREFHFDGEWLKIDHIRPNEEWGSEPIREPEEKATISDSDRLDFIDENLESMSHARATCSVFMGGETIFGRFAHDGRTPRLAGRNVRDLVDKAIEARNT